MRTAMTLLILLAGCGSTPSPRWEDPDALQRKLDGKTPDEVITLIGRPSTTWGDAWSDPSATWSYFNVVKNKATEEMDGIGRVRFAKGKAVAVEVAR